MGDEFPVCFKNTSKGIKETEMLSSESECDHIATKLSEHAPECCRENVIKATSIGMLEYFH